MIPILTLIQDFFGKYVAPVDSEGAALVRETIAEVGHHANLNVGTRNPLKTFAALNDFVLSARAGNQRSTLHDF